MTSTYYSRQDQPRPQPESFGQRFPNNPSSFAAEGESQEGAFPHAKKEDYSQQYTNTEFSPIERSLRINFTRKVFCITAAQLFIAGILVNFFLNHSWFAKINYYFSGFATFAGLVAFITSVALGFSETLSRTVPLNYILLGIFTVAESYTVGFIAGQYNRDVVLTAMYLTAGVVAALAIYTVKTKTEISYYSGLIVLGTFGTAALSFLNWFTIFGLFDSLIFVGTAVMSGLYFIYDVKLLMGQDRFKLSLDDYIKGAMHLYIDIVRIFLNILQIVGKKIQENEQEEEEQRRRQRQRQAEAQARQTRQRRFF